MHPEVAMGWTERQRLMLEQMGLRLPPRRARAPGGDTATASASMPTPSTARGMLSGLSRMYSPRISSRALISSAEVESSLVRSASTTVTSRGSISVSWLSFNETPPASNGRG